MTQLSKVKQNGFLVLERARHIADSVCTSSGNFINPGGLAVVARCDSGLKLSRVALPFSPTSFECDCVRISSSGASCLLFLLYRSGSQQVSSQFFDDLARTYEFLTNQLSPIVGYWWVMQMSGLTGLLILQPCALMTS